MSLSKSSIWRCIWICLSKSCNPLGLRTHESCSFKPKHFLAATCLKRILYTPKLTGVCCVFISLVSYNNFAIPCLRTKTLLESTIDSSFSKITPQIFGENFLFSSNFNANIWGASSPGSSTFGSLTIHMPCFLAHVFLFMHLYLYSYFSRLLITLNNRGSTRIYIIYTCILCRYKYARVILGRVRSCSLV